MRYRMHRKQHHLSSKKRRTHMAGLLDRLAGVVIGGVGGALGGGLAGLNVTQDEDADTMEAGGILGALIGGVAGAIEGAVKGASGLMEENDG
jgi:hypothetical protein